MCDPDRCFFFRHWKDLYIRLWWQISLHQIKKNEHFSLLYMGGDIGLILSPTIAGILFNHYLWLCFVISGVSISVSTVLIAFFIEDTTERIRKESREEVKGQDGNILRVVKNSATLILFLIAMGFLSGGLFPIQLSDAA